MFLRKPVTKEKIENMNKNKLFKVFVMIAFIMCSCEDNFDPKMYGTLNVSNYPVTEAEYESFMMTCYMPFTTTWTYWIGAGTSGNQHGWYIPAGGIRQMRWLCGIMVGEADIISFLKPISVSVFITQAVH